MAKNKRKGIGSRNFQNWRSYQRRGKMLSWWNLTGRASQAQACVSQKTRKLHEPEKPFVKLWPAYSVKLVFSYVVKGIKIKITAKFRDTERLRFEDNKKIMSPEKFRDFRETGPRGLFLESPENFRARKAIRKTTTCLFCEAGLFIYCKGNKNKNNCKVSCLETASFWRYKDNYVTRNTPEKFRDFRETGPRAGLWFLIKVSTAWPEDILTAKGGWLPLSFVMWLYASYFSFKGC